MTNVSIIPYCLNDIPKLLAFIERFYSIDGYQFNAELIGTSLKEFISEPDRGTIWIVKENDIPIGYIILAVVYSFEFGGKNAFVDEFYLEKKFRRKGIGKKVIDFVAGEATKMNIKALHLEVENNNIAARKLYRKFEFKDHHRILMTKTL
jgi:ribosomal protein S18 acetylase RimI-like enzyme